MPISNTLENEFDDVPVSQIRCKLEAPPTDLSLVLPPYDPRLKSTPEYRIGFRYGRRGYAAPTTEVFAFWWGWRDGAASGGHIEPCGPFVRPTAA